MIPKTIVVAGAGQAGLSTAQSLREDGYDGRLLLVGEEPGLPYQRPPLSKAYLKDPTVDPTLRTAAFFAEKHIELVAAHAREIDRLGRVLVLADGARLAYDRLVIATGAGSRHLDARGMTLDGVAHLRTRADADALRERAANASHVVIVGAGFIGLEIAATLITASRSVAIVEMAPNALGRAVSAPIAARLVESARAIGVAFRFGATVHAVEAGSGRVTGVALADGERLAADLVIVAAGAVPRDGLARSAGLAAGGGVPVDPLLATSDPAIFAVGDVALAPNPWGQEVQRVESVQNAIDQARAVAKTLLGRGEPYKALPWFWSDQGARKLQIAGLSHPSDQIVIRGETGDGPMTIGRFRAGRLVAVETIDCPTDHMIGRRLLTGGAAVTPAQFADTSFDLKGQRA